MTFSGRFFVEVTECFDTVFKVSDRYTGTLKTIKQQKSRNNS